MPYKDPTKPENIEAARASRRKHYHNNKEQYYKRNKEKRESMYRFMAAIKSFPCTDCGVVFLPCAMEFDHLPAFTKKGTVGQIVAKGSWKKLVEEIMKCELVCANCHAVRTHMKIAG